MAQKMPSGKWRARVRIDGKLQSLGVYRTKREAEAKKTRPRRNLDRAGSWTGRTA